MTAGSAAPGGEEELTADELLRRLRVPGELTIAEAAALARLDGDPGDDDDWDRDLGWEPQGDLSALAEPAAPEALDAGFTHRYGGTGTGFCAGGPVDLMRPGPGLAWHAGQARQAGLGILSDDELIGVLGAARRLASWQAELELAVVAELDARRASPDGREGEHVAEEIAAALTLTSRSS